MKITKCRWCGSENLKFRKRPETPHFGEYFCGHCDKHSSWIKNPEKQKKNPNHVNTKTVSEVCLFHQIKEPICFFCLREKNRLGANETLTIDHITELNDWGDDQIYNMQILCSACHKLKNWCRLYMNLHFKKEGENGHN